MALRWSGQIASPSEYNGSGSNYINGRIYSNNATRLNNTITITGMYVGHSLNAGFDDPPWQTDMYINGSLRASNAQTKGTTSGSISGNWYYSGTTSHSFTKGTSSGNVTISANWESAFFGDSSAQQGVSVSYPAAGSPNIDTKSVDNITTTSARINWTSSNGTYCTFSSMILQWGLTTSYGNTETGLAADGNTTLTGLQPGTTYNYRLRITNGAGLQDYSNNGTFTTDPVPNASLPLLQILGIK